MTQTHPNKYIELIKVFWKPLLNPVGMVLVVFFSLPFMALLSLSTGPGKQNLGYLIQMYDNGATYSLFLCLFIVGIMIAQKWNTLRGRTQPGFPIALRYYPLSSFHTVGVLWGSVVFSGVGITLLYAALWFFLTGISINIPVCLLSSSLIMAACMMLTFAPGAGAMIFGILFSQIFLFFMFFRMRHISISAVSHHNFIFFLLALGVFLLMFGFTLWNYRFNRLGYQWKLVFKKCFHKFKKSPSKTKPRKIRKKTPGQWIFYLEWFRTQGSIHVFWMIFISTMMIQSPVTVFGVLGLGVASIYMSIHKSKDTAKGNFRYGLPMNDFQMIHIQTVYFYLSLVMGLTIIFIGFFTKFKASSSTDLILFAKILFMGLLYSSIFSIPETTIKQIKYRFHNLLLIPTIAALMYLLLNINPSFRDPVTPGYTLYIYLYLLLYVLYLVVIILRKIIKEKILQPSKITRYSLLWAGCILVLEGILITIKGFSGSLESITLVGGIVTLLILPLFTIPLSVHLERHQ